MMLKRGQDEMVQEYGLLPFEVNVLDVTRTLCEKIMSLVRFSYSETPIGDLRMKIRHVYDLHKMLEDENLRKFLNSKEFDKFICKVAQEDVVSFRNNNQWLECHPADSLIFNELEECWSKLKATYVNDFSGLVYGSLPDEQDILATLVLLRERLQRVKWNVVVR